MRKVTILILLAIIVGVLFSIWWRVGSSPVNRQDKSQNIFVVSKGMSVREIANKLKKQGLIRDPIVFFLLVKKLNLDNKIQAGDFRISPSMNATDIATHLTVGTLDIWITIPEGKRAEEIADMLSDKLSTYQPSWRETFNQQEGYLFPDTYLVPKDADTDLLVSIMKNNFDSKYSTIQNATSLSQEELVILASLIEREARHDEDRPLVSSVMHNRLNIGMKLDIDATVQYALGYNTQEKTWWKKNLTLQDLRFDSPYNTYTNAGLPPTPIANPGIEALQAAANPADTDYIFYFTDKNGVNRYSKSANEHNAKIRQYGL